jgi:hypothetical protein
MKKKIKLKKAGKVLITALVIALGILIYSKLGDIGSEATNSKLALTLCFLGWYYVLFVQFAILIGLWEF